MTDKIKDFFKYPEPYKCSHCGAKAVSEDISEFTCLKCGWWGLNREKMIYEPEEEFLTDGQVPRRPTME
jgi:predicted RNA-binding Zn-ribbon protein involved in translation (DUF1610 family)